VLRGRPVSRVESPEQSEAGSEGQMCFSHLGQVGGRGDPGGTSQKPSRRSTGTRMGLAMMVFIGCSEAQILCDDVLSVCVANSQCVCVPFSVSVSGS